MNWLKIAVDIDGVLYNWDRAVRTILLESPWAISVPYPSTEWAFVDKHLTEEQKEWLWNQGVTQGMFRRGETFPGAIEGVKKLAELGHILLLTSRPNNAVPDTFEWLARYDVPWQSVHFCGQGRPSKSSVEAHVYIEDGPPFLWELASKAVPYNVDIADPAGLRIYTIKRRSLVIGWRAPYNRGMRIPHLMWTNDWEEVYAWIQKFKQNTEAQAASQ